MMRALRNQKLRGILFQILTIMGLVIFLWFIGLNTIKNIEARDIRTGFEFLSGTSGFSISESPIAYSETDTHLKVFLVGLSNTLVVGFVGIIFSTALGLIIGILRLSNNWLIKKMAGAYIDIFRNIPILLQILFWYNVVLKLLPTPRESLEFAGGIFLNNRGLYIPSPALNSTTISTLVGFGLVIISLFFINIWANKRQRESGKDFPVTLIGIGLFIILPIVAYFIGGANFDLDTPSFKGFNFRGGKTITPEFLSLTFALVIYTATFIAEAVRSGIEAVSKGQKEAAKSIGLSQYQALKLVVLPQAIRIAIPPTINQYLNLIKNSSLATAIGYPEIVTVFSGTSLNQVGQAIEIIAMTMLVYLTISLLVSVLLNWFNHKMQIKER